MNIQTEDEYEDSKSRYEFLVRQSGYTDFPERYKYEISQLADAIQKYADTHVPEYRYYIFNPNNGQFISGPMACKTWAKVVCRDKTPKVGAPENEPYVVVDLKKEDIMSKKVDYKRKG